jgi:hypothetical protein
MFGNEILYLYKVRQKGYDDTVGCCYEWQIVRNLQVKPKI